MAMKERLEVGLKAKCPTAQVFRDIYLDSKRGKGAKADFLILHKTGIYMVLTLNYDCMIYGNEGANQWLLKYDDGETDYFPSPTQQLHENVELLNKKCRGIGPYVKPVIVFSEESRIVELKLTSNVQACGEALFLAGMLSKEYEQEIIPASTRDQFAKQLKMLELLSK